VKAGTANVLTLSRLVLTVPIIVLAYAPGAAAAWAALALYVVAGLTDIVDGKLARRDPTRPAFGTYLDPVADKVLFISLFLCMTDKGIIPMWMALILTGREFIVNGVRSAGAAQAKVVGANWMGKTKGVIQNVAIICALCGAAFVASAWTDSGRALLDAAWWVTLAATVAAALFALVFVYWNRALFSTRLAAKAPV
jgi:CDP-diacylglycerol--glycerol-3-phosphate 3-phosphatidyltransferase